MSPYLTFLPWAAIPVLLIVGCLRARKENRQ